MKNILLIEGESGSGKTTIADILSKKYGLSSIQSYTTRKPRYLEETGHTFISKEEYMRIPADTMIAKTEFDGNYYCATTDQVEKNDVYVIDPAGIEYFKKVYHGGKTVIVIYLTASEDERYRRMIGRHDSEEKVKARIDNDRTAFAKAESYADYMYNTEANSPETIAEWLYIIWELGRR